VVVWPAIVAACAALVILVVAVEGRRARARSDRHFARLLQTLDEHLRQISDNVVRSVERSSASRESLAPDLGLTVDFEEVLDQLLRRVAQVTGAQAAAIRVQGPGEETSTRSIGATDDSVTVDAVLGTPGSAQYSSMAVEWTYPSGEWEAAYRSAVAVPIVEDGIVTGALAWYALAGGAFSQEQVHTLQQLAGDAAPSLRNARLFADVARRTVIDATTGIRNRAGYELELEREVARARRTRRPLSLVRLGVTRSLATATAGPSEPDLVARDFAAVLTRVARSTDVLCRRDDTEFVALLPETASEGAGHFCTRLQVAAATNALSHVGSLSMASEVVEWLPDESSTAFDARAASATATLERELPAMSVVEDVEGARGAGTLLRTRAADEHSAEVASPVLAFRESLGAEVLQAHARAEPLAVAVVDVDDLAALEERVGESIGDRILADLEARVAEHVERRGTSSRVGTNQFAAFLREASASEAESLVLALQASLAGWPPAEAQVRISAGITDLTPRDTADSVLDRARHALWQAKQTGNGTIVVAHADGYKPS
jgi:diguanylate cyclase (GGDEF)-like protein